MPEFDNDSDRLEQFFRKATKEPEVPFSEDDWRKLEARLDAADAPRGANVEWPRKKIITAAVVVALLLSSGGLWWGSRTGAIGGKQADMSLPREMQSQTEAPEEQNAALNAGDAESSVTESRTLPRNGLASGEEKSELAVDQIVRALPSHKTPSTSGNELHAREPRVDNDQGSRTETVVTPPKPAVKRVETQVAPASDNADNTIAQDYDLKNGIEQRDSYQETINDGEAMLTAKPKKATESLTPAPLSAEKIHQELVVSSLDFTERNKQKARIDLPGAEEADQTGGQTMVEEEHASEKKEDVAKPRLSLLLSFAPDFSGTSLNQRSTPGKAFAGMIHYHVKDRWSISAGVVKNFKQYTGAGEDYTPPYGYWKYATNGIIPETIEGSCSILEFPVMVQYTVREGQKNRWILGAGSSSYVMQTESYRYYFSEPNPGAKEGWDSRGSSRFMFNMLNLTLGYEHQLIPGLMAGVEPYLKVPLEEIGWCNLKLFSSGISITLRYTLIKKRPTIPVAFKSRGPD